MLVAKRADGTGVVAASEDRLYGPWTCPQCHAPVFIKKGEINVHHFAHAPPVSCEYGAGESDEHRRCKTVICKWLQQFPGAENWELERNLGAVRPDVSGRIGGQRLAIEVQASSLGLDRIAARTRAYAAMDIPVLWLCLCSNERLHAERFTPSIWEKWLHTLYFGRVYYWGGCLSVQPVHFGPYTLVVEERQWYDEYGEEQFAGGYERTSKRWRDAILGPSVTIPSMGPRSRQAWSGGGLSVPACKVWIDNLQPWWKK
jgi:competence protein CoiA